MVEFQLPLSDLVLVLLLLLEEPHLLRLVLALVLLNVLLQTIKQLLILLNKLILLSLRLLEGLPLITACFRKSFSLVSLLFILVLCVG